MEIKDFEPQYAAAFKALNEVWITKHYVMEPKDKALHLPPERRPWSPYARVSVWMERALDHRPPSGWPRRA